MAHGGRRAGAGRKPGVRTKLTAERARIVAEAAAKLNEGIPGAFEGDAHAYLMSVYKDPAVPMELRIDAAKAAIRFEKPTLATISGPGKDGAHKVEYNDHRTHLESAFAGLVTRSGWAGEVDSGPEPGGIH